MFGYRLPGETFLANRVSAMRKAILMLLLAVVSSSAAGAWVNVGGNEIYTAYADPVTIRKSGTVVKMRNLADFKTVQASDKCKLFMSQKMQSEYDCKEKRTRLLDFTWHSGNMGRGEIVLSGSGPSQWEPVAPLSGNAILWKFACGKR
jgi:hypothetical protein